MNTTETNESVPEQMEVKVCLVEHKKYQEFVTKITNDETVEALKARLTEHVGPVEKQTLIYGGVELEDEQCLSFYMKGMASEVPIVLRIATATPPPIAVFPPIPTATSVPAHPHNHIHNHYIYENGVWTRVTGLEWMREWKG